MASSTQYKVYRFGSFALDLKQGALLAADGAEIPLRPKSFSLLRLLVENAGQLLSKEAIMEMLWPNVFVMENNITQCIHEIRHALGSEADQALRTRPRRGYVFTSDVIIVPPAGFVGLLDDRGGSDRSSRTVSRGTAMSRSVRSNSTSRRLRLNT
jgi:DNA-binding winged helix-turn-helix (wHTH) protein